MLDTGRMTNTSDESEVVPTTESQTSEPGADEAREKFRLALEAKQNKNKSGTGRGRGSSGPIGGGTSSRVGGQREFRRKSGG